MKKFAVIGNPIQHSLSPLIHQMFADEFEVKLSYTKIKCVNDEFDKCINKIQNEGFVGVNVTLPFKENAYKIANFQDKHAKEASVANTLFLTNKILLTY